MGFWDIFKEALNESNQNTNSHYTTKCERCGRICKHYIHGLSLTFSPIVGSIETCSKCDAKKKFDGQRWYWIN